MERCAGIGNRRVSDFIRQATRNMNRKGEQADLKATSLTHHAPGSESFEPECLTYVKSAIQPRWARVFRQDTAHQGI